MIKKPATTGSLLDFVVKKWAKDVPRTAETLGRMSRHDIHYGLFSSALGAMVMGYLLPGASKVYAPGDTDILVGDGYYELATQVLPKPRVEYNKLFSHVTRDGLVAGFIGHDVVSDMGDEPPVQLVRPIGPYQCGADVYDTAFTEDDFSHSHPVETDYGVISVAPPYKSVAMYALMQRGGRKRDLANAAAIASVCDPDDPYVQLCNSGMRLNRRELDYIDALGMGSALGGALLDYQAVK